jgi:hypothetical protein
MFLCRIQEPSEILSLHMVGRSRTASFSPRCANVCARDGCAATPRGDNGRHQAILTEHTRDTRQSAVVWTTTKPCYRLNDDTRPGGAPNCEHHWAYPFWSRVPALGSEHDLCRLPKRCMAARDLYEGFAMTRSVLSAGDPLVAAALSASTASTAPTTCFIVRLRSHVPHVMVTEHKPVLIVFLFHNSVFGPKVSAWSSTMVSQGRRAPLGG